MAIKRGFIDATRFPFVEATIYPRIQPINCVGCEPDEPMTGKEEALCFEEPKAFWIEDSF